MNYIVFVGVIVGSLFSMLVFFVDVVGVVDAVFSA